MFVSIGKRVKGEQTEKEQAAGSQRKMSEKRGGWAL